VKNAMKIDTDNFRSKELSTIKMRRQEDFWILFPHFFSAGSVTSMCLTSSYHVVCREPCTVLGVPGTSYWRIGGRVTGGMSRSCL
jgi:hypothetical protein